jgi:translocation and assembly module TamA
MVELASGPAYRFGEIRVSGVRRYSEQLVENLAPFRAGDDYDRDRLLVYQRRLLESGYFVSVQADIEPEEGKPEAALVRVALIEAAKHHVEAGIGYSTDAGPRVELRYNNQDVLDSAWRSRSALRLDNKIRNLQFDFDSPPRPGGYWNSLFTRARETDIQNVFTREFAAGVAHNWGAELTPSSLLMSGHWEQQRIGGDAAEDRHAIYFGHRRTLRKTDDFILPRSGYLAMFEVGGAPAALATRPFLRAVLSTSFFLPVGRRDDLLLRGQAGRVIAASREGIPSTFLFRTGGDQTVRGYAFESLGVHQDEAIVGGRRLIVGSAEFTHWVGEAWGIATFVDAGNAWDDTTFFKAALGYGVGARFRTPIGPIRADLAYGQQSHQIRLHFSVGFTF